MNAVSHLLKDVMLGIDLAILGQSDEVYDAYTRAVRIEYRDVNERVYRENRKWVMLHFQQMARIGTLYPDQYFSDLYCAAANDNIGREIARLSEK